MRVSKKCIVLLLAASLPLASIATVSAVKAQREQADVRHEHTWEVTGYSGGRELIYCKGCGCNESREHEHEWRVDDVEDGREYIYCPVCGCNESREVPAKSRKTKAAEHVHKWEVTKIEENTAFIRCPDCGCNETFPMPNYPF